jgi:cobalt/nickel transport system permease protein
MHIPYNVLSPPVWATAAAVSGAALGASLVWARRGLDDRRIPLMGVMGAFIFAAQMVNFPILVIPGISGHLGGGFLLGVLLGTPLGIIVMASVLVIQACYGDGGVEALGANVFVMGILPCLLGGLTRRLWREPRVKWLAEGVSVVGGTATIVAGAAIVVLLLWCSGTIPGNISLDHALAAAMGVHLPIGIVEGVASAGIIRFILRVRPDAVWADSLPFRAGEASA